MFTQYIKTARSIGVLAVFQYNFGVIFTYKKSKHISACPSLKLFLYWFNRNGTAHD